MRISDWRSGCALPISRRLQPVAQRHQFLYLGNDTVLFGERWEREWGAREILGRHALLASCACHPWNARLDEMRALQVRDDVVWVRQKRTNDVQLCRSATNASGQIAENRPIGRAHV